MVLKIFCDECGKELKENRVVNRIMLKSKTGNEFEIICSCSDREGVWNAGHLCINCIKKLIAESEMVDA